MSVLTPKPPTHTNKLTHDAYYPISVEQYHDMIAKGVLTEEDPVELLEGLLVPKMPKNPAHALALRLLRRILEALLSSKYQLLTQDPLTTADSEPEPDAAVVRGSLRAFATRHPGPDDVCIVIEVSDSSLSRDRGTKKRVYARSGAPLYWIINLKAECVEVYADPVVKGQQADYRTKTVYTKKDSIPVVLDGREVGRISVKEILP